jgi:hypothetical protein
MNPFHGIETILACMVCGYAHGGTTFFTGILSAHPEITGRFECGILHPDHPSRITDLKPTEREILKKHWGVDDAVLGELASCATFAEAYRTLLARSNLEDRDMPGIRIYDKSPAYVRRLPHWAEVLPVPIFVVTRDPRAVFASQLTKKLRVQRATFEPGQAVRTHPQAPSLDAFIAHYNTVHQVVAQAMAMPEHRILRVQLEDLVLNFDDWRNRIFEHLGLETPDADFGRPVVSERKVRSGIDHSVIDGYRSLLSEADQQEILERTQPASAFHHA